MSNNRDFVQLIEYLLKVYGAERHYKNSHEQMLYERGFLTGVLATLAKDDFYAHNRINHLIKKKTKN